MLPLSQHHFRRKKLDAFDRGRLARIGRRSRFEPLMNGAIVVAFGLEPFSAGVRHGPGRFEQYEALLRNRQIDPAETGFARQPKVIARRVVAEQRQPEPVLAARRAVACARVAARTHPDGHHVKLKADRRRDRRPL